MNPQGSKIRSRGSSEATPPVLAINAAAPWRGARTVLYIISVSLGNCFCARRTVASTRIGVGEWKREALFQDELFIKLHGNLPAELTFQRELLIARL